MTNAVTTSAGAVLDRPGAPPAFPRPARLDRWRRQLGPALAVTPFFLVVALGLMLPTIALAVGAFRRRDPDTFVESSTLDNMRTALTGGYRTALLGSLRLAGLCAVLGAIFGVLLASAVVRSGSPLLRRLVLTASGVLANFGGVPLAFAFIATIGNAGAVTTLLADWFGFSLHDDGGFTLYSFTGLTLVYLYFLIPLMVIVVVPALDGIKPQWREAAANLGASRWQYWRQVGGPVLAPPVLGGALLLFCGSLSAFATAQAMVGSTVPLVTLQIANVLSGNVLIGQEGVGAALALDMIAVVILVMVVYWLIQRRTSRWLR
jgi:putative spermidine/putrescine transport system permease protein